MTSVRDKVVIITGAASGQGAAEARMFDRRGAKVILTDIDTAGAAVAASLSAGAQFVRHDVSDEDSWNAVIARTLDLFGRLDVLVNNAGAYRPISFLNTTNEVWNLHYRVNQLGVFLGMRAAARVMQKVGRGSIINIASIGGMMGLPDMFAYATSKWAVRGMTALAATELGPLGIRVNGVYPGAIDTPMLAENTPEMLARVADVPPMKRLGTPEEIAEVVVFLASDAASYVSGAEIKVGGGL